MEPYVDDFDAVCTACHAARCYTDFHGLLEALGLAATPEKDIPPDIIAIFLGLEYDLVNYTLSLPQEKTLRAIAMFESWLVKDHCTKQQLQALLGFIYHISTIIHAGRPFCASLVDLLRKDQFPQPVTMEMKEDLKVWLGFLNTQFSVKSIMKSQNLVCPDETVAVAVRGNKAIFCVNGHYEGLIIVSEQKLSLASLYIVALAHVCDVFMFHLQGQLVLITVPTKGVLAAVNRAKVEDVAIRSILRHMWMEQARHDAVVRAVYIKGENNSHFFKEFVSFKVINV